MTNLIERIPRARRKSKILTAGKNKLKLLILTVVMIWPTKKTRMTGNTMIMKFRRTQKKQETETFMEKITLY